ncbi:MAG: G5 domain-containing protein [Clostridia bacterium]
MLTVQITELVTYEKEIEHEVDKQEDADMYEGDTKTKQEGANGVSEITSRIVLINGEEKEEDPLVTTVKKEPVTR